MHQSFKIIIAVFAVGTAAAVAGCRQAADTPNPNIKSTPKIVFSNQTTAIEAVEFTGLPIVVNIVRIRDKETGVVCYGASSIRLSCTSDLSQEQSTEQAGWTTLSQEEIQATNYPVQN